MKHIADTQEDWIRDSNQNALLGAASDAAAAAEAANRLGRAAAETVAPTVASISVATIPVLLHLLQNKTNIRLPPVHQGPVTDDELVETFVRTLRRVRELREEEKEETVTEVYVVNATMPPTRHPNRTRVRRPPTTPFPGFAPGRGRPVTFKPVNSTLNEWRVAVKDQTGKQQWVGIQNVHSFIKVMQGQRELEEFQNRVTFPSLFTNQADKETIKRENKLIKNECSNSK